MLVLLIDIDGTIQGDISPQVQEYTLIKKLGLKKYNTKLLLEDYAKGLMRPKFVDFIDAYKEKNIGVELFLYTASEPRWAKCIVPVIEKAVGFKFNRPIFTRNHCDMSKNKHKSLDLIAKPLSRAISKKHGVRVSNDAIKKCSFLIDNNFVLQEESHLIKCPTYDRVVHIDPLRQLDNSEIYKFKRPIAGMLLGKEFSKESVWQLLEEVYQHVKIKCMKSHKSDKQSRKDEFWKFLKVIYNKSETGSDFIRTVITHIRRL